VTPYLLKDSGSKNQVKAWLASALGVYAARCPLKWNDEDSLTECFFAAISTTLVTAAGRLDVDAYKIRGRGPRAPENRIGADGIGIVHVDNPSTHLSGFFLFQAKKAHSQFDTLKHASAQCAKMLRYSPASYLLALLPGQVNLVSAMAVASVQGGDPSLNEVPFVSFPRFFVEHLLHGLMLEHLSQLKATVAPEIAAEIRHVLTIIGGRDDRARGVGVGELLADLDFQFERLEPELTERR